VHRSKLGVFAKLTSILRDNVEPDSSVDLIGNISNSVPNTLSQAQIADIIAIPKGLRPNPSEYLSPQYIDEHLAQFDNGATRFMTQSNLEKYGIGQSDGTSFVIPSQDADQLLSSSNGNPRALEEVLGLPENFLSSNQLVRVDISSPNQLNLRIPSGNEAGANPFFIPGGKLPGGGNEAVIDVGGIPSTRYNVSSFDFRDLP
jgi:hypothetical protein